MEGQGGPARRAVAARLKRRHLVALVGADGVSIFGNMLTLVAVPWFVLQTTGSPARTGLIAFFAALPVVIGGPFGGVVVDRLGYRRTSVIADLASGATVVLIPVLHLLDVLGLWQLAVLVFLSGLLDIPAETARKALLPDLLPGSGVSLERATAARAGVIQAAYLLGAPVAGASIAVMGATSVLFIDAATFGVAALMVWSTREPGRDRDEEAEAVTVLTELIEGVRFIWEDRLLRAIVVMIMLTNFADFGAFTVVFPVYADDVLGGAGDLALMFAVFGVGAFAGTIVYGAVGERLPRHRTFLVMFLILGAPRFLVLAAEPHLLVLLAVLFTTGVASGPINPIFGLVEYERTPLRMRGRVFGVVRAVTWGSMPLGSLTAGFAVAAFGLRPTLLAVAGVYGAATIVPAVGSVWREMDGEPQPL